jgi:hypothetical protein
MKVNLWPWNFESKRKAFFLWRLKHAGVMNGSMENGLYFCIETVIVGVPCLVLLGLNATYSDDRK